MRSLDSRGFQNLTGVSRETLARLETYERMIHEWQTALNLVSSASLDDIWRRHFLDSAQLWSLLAPSGSLFDIGSGAGFPGLVLAIMGRPGVTLIEADTKKATFISEVIRETGADATVINDRVEGHRWGGDAASITARAVAPLPKLLDMAAPLIGERTVCVFPKGRRAEEELTAAGKNWNMRPAMFPSLSDRTGTILRLTEVQRATD